MDRQWEVFYEQPWFSIEGGMTWVDVSSCEPFRSDRESKQAIFVDLDIVDLDEPIKITEYIERYC